ncbi:MAG: VCBS repeat-containing protein, partial [Calditrichia bacterium]|nr:VCBS repeat-containing protein [Calditrichia bacterium]
MNIIFKIIISTLFVFLLVQSLKPQSALSTNHKDSTAKWADSFFQQLESNSKIPEFDDAYGVIFRDLNGNGLADLYVVRFRNLNRLLQNRKKGRYFRERTIGSGLGGNLSPSKDSNLELGTSAVDYNNDDIPEISIAGWGKTSSLYQKQKKWN